MNIIVIESGFVYIGKLKQVKHEILGNCVLIQKAQNIRDWGTTKGLGQLASLGKTDITILDYVGTVTVPISKVLHIIDVEPNAQKTFMA